MSIVLYCERVCSYVNVYMCPFTWLKRSATSRLHEGRTVVIVSTPVKLADKGNLVNVMDRVV